MSVAVIIVNYESDELLWKCLDALSNQSLNPQTVIVIDNHEERQALTKFKQRFPEVKFISTGANIGFAAAANLGVSQAGDVEFIALLNPDAFPEKNWLQALMDAAETHPNCGSFSSLMLQENAHDTLDGCGDVLHFSGLPWRVGHDQRRKNFSVEKAGRFSACAGAALYRVKAWHEAGGFDESFFMYVEDVDLGFRLQLLGYSCSFVSEAVVRHIGSAIAGRRSDFALYYGHRNLVWNYAKNMPWQLLVLTLPSHILMTLAVIALYVFRGRGGVIFKAKRDAVSNLPKILRKRKFLKRSASLAHVWGLLNKTLLPVKL